MKNHRALFCIALVFAGILSANAAGPNTSILSGSSADPLAGNNGGTSDPYSTSDNVFLPGNPGPNSDLGGSTGSFHPAFDAVPGPVACGPFVIGLIAVLRRRNKKA